MRLVEILSERKKPTSLKDVAQAAGLNKVTTHRLLRSLCSSGVVQMIGDNGHYGLGPAVLTFAEGFRKSFTIRDRVLPYLEKLANFSKETAIFCEKIRSIGLRYGRNLGQSARHQNLFWNRRGSTSHCRVFCSGDPGDASRKRNFIHHRRQKLNRAFVLHAQYKKTAVRQNKGDKKNRLRG